jgi:two-component system capsular synthesis response regulator RcsB
MHAPSYEPLSHELRIAIADDHPVIRHAAAAAFSRVTGMCIAASVASGAELLDALQMGEWHLVITDLLMHGVEADRDGLHLVRRLKRLYPAIPIIVFTMVRNRDILQELDQMDVAGIVTKTESVGIFIEAALDVALHSRRYRSAGLKAILDGSGPAVPALADRSSLTGKELEVIRMYGAGLSLTDIAARVSRSVSTVATQKGNAMRKLGMTSNADLIRYAQINRLIQ